MVIDDETPPTQGARAFIDLARLGRTDWRSAVAAFLKIAGCQFALAVIGVVAAFVLGRDRFKTYVDDPFIQVGLIALTTAAWYAGLYWAVVGSQRRPFLSLLSVDRRLDVGRVAMGVLLWFACWLAITLLGGLAQLAGLVLPDGGATQPIMTWPPARDLMLATLLSLPVFPFQAAAEELTFRGWVTQTVGQFIRWTWLVALIVAILFAAGHLFAGGIVGFIVYVTMSLGFSAISLFDRRLELAIGLHAANNMFIVILGMFYASPDNGQGLIHYPTALPWAAVPAMIVQYAIAYGLVRLMKTR
jgi:membrane protease YdiL (CAAX protease family)